MNHHQANELLDCPHCGKSEPVRICRSSEDEDWDSTNPDCYAVICDASSICGQGPGGCGAAGGYFEAQPQAIAAWNRRAAPTEPAVDPRITAFYKLRDIAERDMDIESANVIQAAIGERCAAPAAPAVPAAPLVARPELPTLAEDDDAVFPNDTGLVVIREDRYWNLRGCEDICAALDAKPSPSVDQAKRLVGGEVAADPIDADMLLLKLREAGILNSLAVQHLLNGAALELTLPELVDLVRASTGPATSTDTKESA